MQTPLRRILFVPDLPRRGRVLAVLLAAAAMLEVAAGVGLSYLAGFGQVRAVLVTVHWEWIAVLAGALLVSLGAYAAAYRGVFRVEGGPVMSGWQVLAVVVAGFAGFVAQSGVALDRYVLEAAGATEEEAKVRVATLALFEQGVLALGGCVAAIAVLAEGLREPPLSGTIPWAVVPVPGFLIAFWAAERYRHAFSGRPGWRGHLGVFLESVHLLRLMFLQPRRTGAAIAAMAMYWAAEAFAAWAGLAAFGFQMHPAALFVGFASGMVFTRRTGPLAGAGVLALLLPLTIWYSGAPLPVAIAGIFAYRMLALWLPVPASLAVLPTLRKMGRRRVHAAASALSRTDRRSAAVTAAAETAQGKSA